MYLDTSVKIEPLVDRWYAWPHLLAPVQQAINLAYRYLPGARSFVSSPRIHAAAAKNPDMFGGPFIDLPETAVDDMRKLIKETEVARKDALAFVEAFRKLDKEIQATAAGGSLDPIKDSLPEALYGFVDIVYSLHNDPKLRLMEEILSECDLGLADRQEILLHRQPDTERAFFLSTPRLRCDDGLFIRAPFASDAVKAIVRSRRTPTDLQELARITGASVEELRPFFVDERKKEERADRRYSGDGVRIRYFGHACVLIETRDVSILVDPTAAWDSDPEQHLSFHDFPDQIDFLALSHGHQDHLHPETLIQLRDRIGTVLIPPNNQGELADPSLRLMLKTLGYDNIKTLNSLEAMPLPDGQLTSIPFSGEHCDLDIHSKQCFAIDLKKRRIALFVDSDAIDLGAYSRIVERIDRPDLMLVGMECFGAPLSWLYGPLLTKSVSKAHDQSRRLSGANCSRAWRLADRIKPKQAYVYAMGQEPWMRYLMGLNYTEDSIQLKESNEFVSRCNDAGIAAERMYGFKEIEL